MDSVNALQIPRPLRHCAAFVAVLGLLLTLYSSMVVAGEATSPGIETGEFLRNWRILAPIPPGPGGGAPDADWLRRALQIDRLHTAGGEAATRPDLGIDYMIEGQRLAWHFAHSLTDIVGLGAQAPPGNYVSGYAFTEFEVSSPGSAFLGLGSSDGIEVWLNGKRIEESWTIRAARPDEDVIPVRLIRGRNRLLLKVQSVQNTWGFSVRLMGERAQADALTAAVYEADPDRLSHLLDLGVDINTKDSLGLSAYQAARLRGSPLLLKLLARRGALRSAALPASAVLTDRFFGQLVARGGYGRFPGAAVLIAQNGRILLERDYGYSDLEHHTPVSASTRFRLGSITKQFTAVAALQLRDEGKLDLGESLSRYFPDFPQAREVTVEELLRHTSGIREYETHPGFYTDVSRPIPQTDLVRYIAEGGYDFLPGTRFSYSNSNYIFLGRIIEQTSGESYGGYLKKHLLEPLRMNNTGIYGPPDPQLDAFGYDWNGTSFVRAFDWDQSWTASSGGLYSTVEDLYRWIQALTSGGSVRPGTPELTKWSTLCTPETLADGTGTGHGYACFVGRWHGVVENHWGGSLYGASSLIVRLPADDFTFIVLTNGTYSADGLDYWKLFARTAEFYLGEKLMVPEIQTLRLSARELESVAGLYDLGPGGNQWPGGLLEVTHTGGRLLAGFPPQPETEIIPTSDGEENSIDCRWNTRDGDRQDASIKFVKGPSGTVIRAIYQAHGQVVVAPKLPIARDQNVDAGSYDAFVGRYSFGKDGPWMSITHDGRHLYAQYGTGPTYEIFPDSPTEFFWNTTNARIAFNRGRNGLVADATLHLQNGATRTIAKLMDANGQ
ncbi:MAG TPA: serine hydrolase [Steroidobacteraceae bacterium]